MQNEGKLQSKIITFLKSQVGFVEAVKQIKTNLNGIPDLLILWGNNEHLWIEVKTETGQLSKLQEFRIKKLRQAGDYVIVPYGWEDFLKQYDEYDRQRNHTRSTGE